MSNFLQEKSHKALIETIKEYLEYHGYKDALKVLEVTNKQLERVPEKSSVLSSLIQCLDRGDSQQFFTLWDSLPQESSVAIELKNLEFFLRVFFAIYPCHQINTTSSSKDLNNSRYKKNMDDFRRYLDTEGYVFSKNEEVLSYFALPYMPNPSEHPAFRQIFTNKWLNSLKDKIRVLIGKESLSSPPILQLMYDKYIDYERPLNTSTSDKQLLLQIHSLENTLALVNEENAKLQQKFTKFEHSYEEYVNEVLGIAKDLYKALDAAKAGKGVNELVLAQSYNALSKFDKSLQAPVVADARPVLLNFATIIRDLTSLQDDLQICALLQALRWRLTRTPRSQHKENLESFIRFNILCTIKPHDALLDNLLVSTRRVKEYTIRFLNVLTSEKSGRVYLLQKENIVGLLTNILYSEKQDNLLRQNTLGVLQKLSLKRSAQIEMIKLDVLDWLMKILKHDVDVIADYTLEYATALLMNLSLRTMGKDKLSKHPTEVISVLNRFIAHENNQVRTYINGTLYSILTRKALKEAALKTGIKKKLKVLKLKSEENIKRQLNFILEQLKQEENECQTDESEEEIEENNDSGSEDDDDEILDDEDMDDAIVAPNVPTGEYLLRLRYEKGKVLSAASSRRDLEESKESAKISSVKKPESSRKKTSSKVVPVKENSEYNKGFSSRDKIPRTPL